MKKKKERNVKKSLLKFKNRKMRNFKKKKKTWNFEKVRNFLLIFYYARSNIRHTASNDFHPRTTALDLSP